MDDAKKIFGNNIASLRVLAKLTQSQLAEKAGISIRMLQRLEHGETFAGNETISKLSEVLCVPMSELFSSKEDSSYKSFKEASDFLAMFLSAPRHIQRVVLMIVYKDASYLADEAPETVQLATKFLKALAKA